MVGLEVMPTTPKLSNKFCNSPDSIMSRLILSYQMLCPYSCTSTGGLPAIHSCSFKAGRSPTSLQSVLGGIFHIVVYCTNSGQLWGIGRCVPTLDKLGGEQFAHYPCSVWFGRR